MSARPTLAVVGASLAGVRAVEAARRAGFGGRIVLIGAERHLPYDRPPLSKELLAGVWESDEIVLRRAPYEDLDLDLRLGVTAVGLDVGGRHVRLDDGSDVEYDAAVLATGARPRAMPVPVPSGLDGVYTLRTLDDGLRLRAACTPGARVCVIGAGFIGAEVAATCRGLGLDVTVLEALEQPMARAFGPEIGGALASLHRDHGVDLRLGVAVESVSGQGHVERVHLEDGSSVPCDVLLVAVGVTPATDWLEDSGLVLDDGVVCDVTCAAAPGVYAAGDVCRWPHTLFDGVSLRVEHWTNAAEQGGYVGARAVAPWTNGPVDGRGSSVSDVPEPFAPVPFVWSYQYDAKIQSVGVYGAQDRMEIVHGSLEERQFVALFERAGRLTGALALNRARLLIGYRRMIAERARFEDALARAREA